MADQLPDPLVPAEVDLRGMEFIPLKGDVLFKSTTWLKGSHEGRCAALRLWWHAFAHEVPAASLPDDDQLLAEHAGYGEVVKAWLKIKPQAMRGWVKCSDGRWYHKLVAELALEAWNGRVRNREKARKWREKKAGGTPAGDGNENGSVTVTQPVRNRLQSEEQEQLQTQGQKKTEGAGAPRPLPAAAVVPVVEPDIDLPLANDRRPEAEALKLWNETAERIGLPTAQKLTDPRRRSLKARLSESGGLDGWRVALAKVEGSSFLTGKSGRTGDHANWRCDLDFILREAKFTKLMEGGFDDTPGNAARGGNGPRSVQHGGESPTAVGVAAAFARRSVLAGG